MVYRRGGLQQHRIMGDHSGRIREDLGPRFYQEEVTHMDNYIIERRARIRLAWFKRFEDIANVSQVCREFGISRKTFYKWCPVIPKKISPV